MAKKAVTAKAVKAPKAKAVKAEKPVKAEKSVKAVKGEKPAKSPTVTLRHLSTSIAEGHDLPKKQVTTILEEMIGMMRTNLKKGNRIRIAGLGILQVRKRAARIGRNPATGEQIKIKASKKIAFRAAKDLKELI